MDWVGEPLEMALLTGTQAFQVACLFSLENWRALDHERVQINGLVEREGEVRELH